jgi:hypothetical protein
MTTTNNAAATVNTNAAATVDPLRVKQVAAWWAVSLDADTNRRLRRAVKLVLAGAVRPGDRSPNVFFVKGEQKAEYFVRVNRTARTSTCNCDDARTGAPRCKHRLAAALWERARA